MKLTESQEWGLTSRVQSNPNLIDSDEEESNVKNEKQERSSVRIIDKNTKEATVEVYGFVSWVASFFLIGNSRKF